MTPHSETIMTSIKRHLIKHDPSLKDFTTVSGHSFPSANMFQRQLEYISVLIFNICVLGLPVIGCSIVGYCLVYGNITRYLAIAYLIHGYYDRKYNDGVRNATDWFRLSFLFRYVSSYFSMKMVVTAEIPTDCNYIIGSHPHGFLTYNSLVFTIHDLFEPMKKVFGDGYVAFATAPYNLKFPLQRDFFKALGSISATEASITRRLTSAKSGNHLTIVLGGAEEAAIISSTEYRLILNKRKGFCKIALKTGSHLLPMYAFGETKNYDTIKPPKGSLLEKIQKMLFEVFGVGLPIIKGPGKYQYFFVMPRRTPMTMVFGKPIPVQKVENPTREQVSELHAKYVSGLVELFDKNKAKYLNDKNAKLIID